MPWQTTFDTALVGRVTPCVPETGKVAPHGAQGVTHPA